MKTKYLILSLSVIFSVIFTNCDFFEDIEKDQPSVFYIDFNEDATEVLAGRDNTISIDVIADKGVSKVELRQNFETVDGSEKNYDGEKEATYLFEINPEKSMIGENLEYSIVAFNTEGYAINEYIVLTVKKAPSLVKILLPPTAPSSINYDDTVSFDVPFSSSTQLEKIMINFEDEIIFEKSSGFSSPEADIINFYYDNFDILSPGEERDFEFNFIGIAPINETEFDTTIVTYSVFVKGPREPLPVSVGKDVQLGFQANSNIPQFIDVDSGELYFYLSEPSGMENSVVVDFGFYRSSSSGLCLTNPVENTASTWIYKDGTYGFNAWETRNQTEFVKVADPLLLDETKFYDATDDGLFYDAYENASVIGDTFKGLLSGDIIVFRTVDGKFGAILIHSYENSSSGIVDFTYKIQK